VARRKILKAQDRWDLFAIPADEDSLIRHYSLSAADRLEIELRRRVRIPMKPAIDSETKPATCSDFIPASIPI